MSTVKRLHSVSFLVTMLLVLLIIAWILQPFFNILIATLIVAILVYPIYKYILAKLNKPALASLLTVGLVLLVIVLPIVFFGQILYSEINSLYDKYRDGGIPLSQEQIIASIPPEIRSALADIGKDVNGTVSRFTNDLFSSVKSVATNVAAFVFAFFMFIFILYYALKDGHRLRRVFKDLSPLASGQEDKLIDKLVLAVNGVIKGQFLTALVQGVVATIGYYIFGLPEPLIWGAFTVVAALVPTVGTSLVVIPAVIYLLITGETTMAIGMAIWGAAAVGLIDNFVGPKFVGSTTKLHPVLVLLSILGGLQFFGVLGFLIGPIIMAVFVAMVEIYRDEFKDYINAKK